MKFNTEELETLAEEFEAFTKIESEKTNSLNLNVTTIDETLVDGKIIIRNIISRFDGHCSRCCIGFKMGTKIRWSKPTGALCFPSCKISFTSNDIKYKRQFDFKDDEE